MKFDNDMPCVDENYGAAPDASLSAIMDKANCLAEEVLRMAYSINRHLFGLGEPADSEKQASPACFRDVLSMQTATLNKAAIELEKIAKLLGL